MQHTSWQGEVEMEARPLHGPGSSGGPPFPTPLTLPPTHRPTPSPTPAPAKHHTCVPERRSCASVSSCSRRAALQRGGEGGLPQPAVCWGWVREAAPLLAGKTVRPFAGSLACMQTWCLPAPWVGSRGGPHLFSSAATARSKPCRSSDLTTRRCRSSAELLLVLASCPAGLAPGLAGLLPAGPTAVPACIVSAG